MNSIEQFFSKICSKKMLWKKLAMKNTWLAIANEPTNGAITCNGVRQDISFDGIMVTKIKDACIITTKTVNLRGRTSR
jgi:hypothetical protein